MSYRKIAVCLLATLLLLLSFTGCGGQVENTSAVSGGGAVSAQGAENQTLKIVATTFPLYDWVRQVLGHSGGNVELTLLMENGVDLHSYQPSVEDIAKISGCDLFIYVGGESEKWIADALKTANNRDMVAVNLLEALGDRVKTEELAEGMEDDHGHEEDEHHADAEKPDEHVWLSLKNARAACGKIADALEEKDPQNAKAYAANAAAYGEKLAALDAKYQEAADSGTTKTLLFGDRFPFRYLLEDYGLNYYAAFPGCSAETEASFETIVFLADKLDELRLKDVLVIETSDQSIAKTIVQSTAEKNQSILVMDSMQAITMKEVEAGETYLSVMEKNLTVFKQALEN